MNMIITTSLPIPDKIMITNVMVFTICMLAITFDIFSTHSADYKAKKEAKERKKAYASGR